MIAGLAGRAAREAATAEDHDVRRNLLSHVLRASGATSVDQLLFDPVTSLPGLQLLAPQIEQALATRNSVGLLAISIAQFSKLELVYGWEAFDEMVRGFAACLQSIKEEALRKDDAVAELTLNGNVFILMLSPPRKKKVLSDRDLARVKGRIVELLDAYVVRALAPELVYRFKYFIGSAVMKRDASVRAERLLYRSIDEALAEATSARDKLMRRRAGSVRRILERRRVSTLYQPIVDLRTRAVMGYEALSRGPKGEFESPDVLFRVAYEADLVFRLDRLCRERALRGFDKMRDDQLLFINMEPLSIFDPMLAKKIPARRAARTVFEITEHAAIADFTTFRQAVQLVKASGFKFALDDVGSAYSGLRIITEIEPDFIKLDMELTRAAHGSRVKMELIRAVAGFCAEAGVPMIVEGVETAEELQAVTELGANLVQGYLVGRPVNSPAGDPAELAELPAAVAGPRMPAAKGAPARPTAAGSPWRPRADSPS
jgi:EAL domain-containing protein (putative c-di-GMP-specific phosphodiesterase class I)/GGDEF domain-containing protein